jgi:hypothetical protein
MAYGRGERPSSFETSDQGPDGSRQVVPFPGAPSWICRNSAARLRSRVPDGWVETGSQLGGLS